LSLPDAISAEDRPHSLLLATDIDVLPADKLVARRDGYLMVRSPSNPEHYWGNLLIFDHPPRRGDRRRWEDVFAVEFEDDQRVQHRTFAWDRSDGALGAAREEFGADGYQLERTTGLTAPADRVRAHPRANRDVIVRDLDSARGADEGNWKQVLELQVAARDARFNEDPYRRFARLRLDELRALFRAGRGAWYVALHPSSGDVLGSCGIVVTGVRGRFQAVDTAEAHRRRGICSRLLVEAAHHASSRYGACSFVIAADPDYHALGLYESLGFTTTEHVAGVYRPPAIAMAGDQRTPASSP
jgi:ribosomal protein S18 acetylase RimI-like enzyme